MPTDSLRRIGLLLFILFFLLVAETSAAGWVNIFVYHRFGDSRYPSTNISLDDFAAHLEILKQEKVVVLPLGEVVRRLRSNSLLPERCAVLTVDDGYDTFLSGAMPLLRRYGFPATLFVSTGSIGKTGYLTWRDLTSLAAEGIEIGNHTHGHDYLVDRRENESEEEWLKRIEKDIACAQTLFRKNLGIEPRLFSYPFGEYVPEVVDLLVRCGFSGAVVQHSGTVDQATDPFLIPRFAMGASYGNPDNFLIKLRMRPLPVTVIDPPSPLLGSDNPPSLQLQITSSDADLSRLRCYVGGRESVVIQKVPGFPERRLILAGKPLTSRRTTYVLTAPSRDGKEWYWFSHLWIKKGRVASGAGYG
ncbi:MAG: polysaccharide deacetylase family protein [Desulfuromonadaceae bacterium]|nr:polysaccharide deacetylase family protein [Desulfuromonadaceae bacterium]